MRPRAPLVASLVFVVALAGCTTLQQNDEPQPSPSITGRGSAQGNLSSILDATELEAALLSYGECVEQSFPIVLRFRTDAFTGLYTEVGSQNQSDGDRVDEVTARCNNQFEIDSRLSEFQSQHPLSAEAHQQLADEFTRCLETVSQQAEALIRRENPESYEDVQEFMSLIDSQRLSPDTLFSISRCHLNLSGPARPFTDGHPWFTPEP